MKSWAIAVVCLLAPAMAKPADEGTSPSPPTQQQFGYAFEHLSVLAQQVLYGRAHGVSLLAAACDAETPIGIETREAFTKWHEAQIHAIAKMEHDLANWYFTSEAQNVTHADIIKAMNLPAQLGPNVSEEELSSGCATFAQMLQGERYDLAVLLAKISKEVSSQVKVPAVMPVLSTQ